MPTMPAILGTALRLGNFRLGYVPAALAAIRRTRVRILLAGTDVRVRVAGLMIRDDLNETPNTCGLTISSPAPTTGNVLRITINSDAPRLLFNGTIQTDDLSYEGQATQVVYPCAGIDDTAKVNKKRPFGTWTNISATTIAQSITTDYASGFTSAGVEASLPLVTVTFDGSTSFMGCLMQLATLIGGYCNVIDGVVHLFLEDATDLPDDLDSSNTTLLHDPPIRVSRDDSQLRTRVYGKGHAEAASSDVLAADTAIPVDDTVMFNAVGGQAIASTTPDGAQSQILTYTGVHAGGGGTVIGPGALPSTAPTLAAVAGAGLSLGVYQGAYTFVTAAGESLPGPSETVTIVAPSPPPAPSALAAGPNDSVFNNGITQGATYTYKATYSYATSPTDHTNETAVSAISANCVPVANLSFPGNTSALFCAINKNADQAITWIHIWRTAPNGSTYTLQGTFSNAAGAPAAVGGYDTVSDATVAAAVSAPGSSTASVAQVSIAGIALGPSGTTQRKYYRTVVNGSQLKLQQTIANNTATVGVQDATADGSLGANVPVTDTSGLSQPFGQVNAGSTSIPAGSPAPFDAAGGWALLPGGNIVRYTGLSGNTLTGIPASGAGSITTTVFYNDPILPAPALTGVTGLTLAIAKGTPVHIWVQRDDVSAQGAAAIRESTATYTSDGIHEHLIVDGRRGEDSLIALCDADLALYATPILTVTYATRDVKTKSGKPIVVNLASPPISETLTIQDVTITEIDQAPFTDPRFSVTASSVRFSLEDLLRRLAAA